MVRIRIAPEFGAGPLWWDDGQLGPVEPSELPLTPSLVADLERWQDEYDATLDQNYPPDSLPPGPDWYARAGVLLDRLRAELGPAAVVSLHLPAG